MTTNNEYLKSIAETVTETEISGTHADNYYLKLICTTYGYTYTGTVCDGKLIKDFASYITSKTYNRIHFDNKYYHDIAESLTGNTYDNKYDNFYLGIIAENITPPTPVMTLDHIGVELIAGNQILSYADEQQTPNSQYATVRFVAYADAGETETIPNLSLDFQVGTGTVTTVTTDSNGRYEYTYHSIGAGDVEISTSKMVEGILVSKTYEVEDCDYYNDGTKDDLIYQNGDFGSVVSEGLQLKGTTNSYQKAVIPTSLFSTNDNVSCEIKLGTYTSITPQLALYDSSYTNQGSVTGNTTYNEISSELSTSARTVRNSAPAVNEVWKISRENGQSKLYIDDVLLDTVTRSINNFRFGFYTYNNRTEVIKYIKIKPL